MPNRRLQTEWLQSETARETQSLSEFHIFSINIPIHYYSSIICESSSFDEYEWKAFSSSIFSCFFGFLLKFHIVLCCVVYGILLMVCASSTGESHLVIFTFSISTMNNQDVSFGCWELCSIRMMLSHILTTPNSAITISIYQRNIWFYSTEKAVFPTTQFQA